MFEKKQREPYRKETSFVLSMIAELECMGTFLEISLKSSVLQLSL